MAQLWICGQLGVLLRSFFMGNQFFLAKTRAPYEINWPGVSKGPWYNNFKPSRPLKRRLLEVFRHFDQHALELLEKMLTLDPSQRISAKDSLDAEYFWIDPLPCDPKSFLVQFTKVRSFA